MKRKRFYGRGTRRRHAARGGIMGFVIMAGAAIAILLLGSVGGAGIGRVYGQALARTYIAEAPLQVGMIVRLADDGTKVAPVAQADASKIFGLVVQPNDVPLSLSESRGDLSLGGASGPGTSETNFVQEQSETGGLVYVAGAGGNSYRVLVSTQNGVVAKDDYISVSAVAGIGMKSDTKQEYVVGKALSSFDGVSEVLSQTTVKDKFGNKRTVKIGYVMTDINVHRNPLFRGGQAEVPGFLQRTVDAIANESVSPVKAYLSVVIMIVTGVIVCIVLYASVRASMIALGRNPLARRTIIKNMFQVIIIALIILVIGMFAVYLVLKL